MRLEVEEVEVEEVAFAPLLLSATLGTKGGRASVPALFFLRSARISRRPGLASALQPAMFAAETNGRR